MKRRYPIQSHLLGFVILVALLAALPLFVTERYYLGQIIIFMIWAGVASQWNVLTGHAGVFSLAQMLFFAIGAYGVAMLASYLEISPWLGIVASACLAGLAALVIGMACLRLATAYVALLTFAIANMVVALIVTDSNCYVHALGACQPFFGGSNGFSQFPDLGFRKLLHAQWIIGDYFVVLAAFAISFLASIAVIHGRIGLAFRALSDSSIYAAARGINRTRFRLVAFVITAFFTGMMGGVHAAHFRYAGPSLFDFSTLLFVLSMIIIGGLKSTWGPVFGAAMMMVLVEFAKSVGDIRNTVIGVVLVLFVALLPKGIAGATGRLFGRLREVRGA